MSGQRNSIMSLALLRILMRQFLMESALICELILLRLLGAYCIINN